MVAHPTAEPLSFQQFCKDQDRVDGVMKDVYARGNRVMSWLVGLHAAFTVVFASFYGTWLASAIIGGAAAGMFFLSLRLLPRHIVTRIISGISVQTFVALHIWQMHGMPEMHFFFFTGFTAMVVYEDGLSMWPGAILIILQHLIFAILHNSGSQVYFFPELYVSFTKLFFHFGIAILQVALCGSWAVFLRHQALLQAFQREALSRALSELEESQEARSRAEKLAAIGQLAASVGHELRNPLAAVRNAASYLSRRLTDPKFADKPANDPKIAQFLGVMQKELDASAKIISDLLDFARERKPRLLPCPLRPLVEDVFSLVPRAATVRLVNAVPDDLPVPSIDKDQFRQVLMNLVQNAVEAVAECADREEREVKVQADSAAGGAIRIAVVDNGHGIPPEVLSKIFQPLYTTKIKGTGLGLAVVSSTLASHNASIDATSEIGKGTQFTILLPPEANVLEAAPQPAPAFAS
jgi:two-component system sensor histidine kinase HydH